MSKNDDSFFNINIPMALIFLILPIAAGYYLAALFSVNEPNDIYTVIERCKIIIDKPLDWYFNLFTIPAILFMILLYAMTVLVIACMHKQTRYGEEQGSSHLISPYRVSKVLADHNNSIDDPKNIVIYKAKKLNFFQKTYYKWKYRKAD
jgi:hypothetical protein